MQKVHCSSKGRLENWCRWDTGASRSEVLPKCWLLCAPVPNRNTETVTEEKEREGCITLPAKETQQAKFLKNCASLVSRERLYSQAGECHKIQGSNSSVSSFCRVSKGLSCWLQD